MKSRPIEAVSRGLVAGLLAAAPASEVVGADARRVEVRIEVKADPVTAGALNVCAVSREIVIGVNGSFWAFFGQVRPDADRTWNAAGAEILCGKGAFAGKPRPDGFAGVPYVKVEAVVTPLKSSETATGTAVLVTLRKLSGFSSASEPIYSQVLQRRNFTIESGGDALVPVLAADPREESEFRVHEVMLRIEARPVSDPAADYGAVSIRSDAAGAEIRLDGGLVDRTSQDKTALLRNVPVGDHEVRIREASGRVARQVVRVRKDLTVRVAPGASLVPNGRVPIGKNDRGYEEHRRNRDGAVMVKVPEGEFHMGNLETEGHPQPHTVYVSTFLMDKTPVTWRQYQSFLESTGWPLPPDEPYWGIHDDQPAVFVTWEESRAYCEWVGGRLPNEAEREKAARGTDERKYPWGDQEPDSTLATFRHNWGDEASTPVGSHPAGASPYGLLDMGGNVWEWCEDWWDPDYFKVSPERDPRGPATGRAHVVKGGSWDSRPSVLSSSSRNFGYIGYREGDFGFRCAADIP
jgi:formylglycine-generating enzyme required for sulfatase activity